MIICELEFNTPDPENPKYSLAEVDYYAWIPAGSGFPNHRLSLRKNLETGEFEVYRAWEEKRLVSRGTLTMIQNVETGSEEVAFSSKSLEEAIKFADNEYHKFHGEKMKDEMCQHKYPVKAIGCPVKEVR
jgi:hypothetical protein